MPVPGTKLRPPRPRRRLAQRARLIDRMGADGRGGPRLVLVAAPAGFGKTTLVAPWLAAAERSQRRMAWLALAPGDADVRLFLTSLVAAIRTVEPEAGADALALLEAGATTPTDDVLVSLIKDLDAAALEARTEGWAAGLQLAALSARTRARAPDGSAGEVAGSSRPSPGATGSWLGPRFPRTPATATPPKAVRELLRLCFRDLGVRRVTANCFLDNDTSWRLMERVGMRRELRAVRESPHRSGRWLDTVGCALLEEEWSPNLSQWSVGR